MLQYNIYLLLTRSYSTYIPENFFPSPDCMYMILFRHG